jgi:predicted 3-demethylubiquinone-9 3-methyltransferase (glyoxalase superfamily)
VDAKSLTATIMGAMSGLVPCLMFVGDQCGRAQDAIDVYVSAFADSRILEVERFGLALGSWSPVTSWP